MMMMTLVSVGDFFRMWIYIYIYSTVAAAAGSSRHTIHSPSTFSSQLYHTHIKDIEHYPKHEILPSPSSSSRYDPREIVRIHDITDLVDDEHEHNNNISNSDDEDDEEINAPPRHNSLHAGTSARVVGGRIDNSSRRDRHRISSSTSNVGNTKSSAIHSSSSSSWFSSIIQNRQIHCPSLGGRRWWVLDLSNLDISRQQVILLVSLVGIITVASVGIGYAVVGPNLNGNVAVLAPPLSDESHVVEGEVIVVDAEKEQGVVEIVGEEVMDNSSLTSGEGNEHELFQIAEQVVTACAESNLDVDMSACQSLCHARMCCFENESDRYSCVDDVWKHCVVYAACANLLDEFPMENGNGGRGRRRNR